MEAVKRINILGCPFDSISFSETVHNIKQAVVEGKTLQVVPGNVDFVMKARRDPIFAQELWQANLVVADGVPIVWAASLLGNPICGRVSGTDLVWSCAEISAEIGCAVALIGGKSGVAHRAAQRMRERYPKSKLYAIPTAMPLDYYENEKLVEQIMAVHASIILVALGAPRQERWVQANLVTCKANVGIGIGSAFDIICGDTPRAPDWMKDRGLEWLYRMLQEPRRLGKRYLIEDSPFLFHLAHAIIRKRPFLKP